MSNKNRMTGVVAGISVATAMLAAHSAQAAQLYTSNGFEATGAPTFSATSGANNLVGQGGFLGNSTTGATNVPTAGIFMYSGSGQYAQVAASNTAPIAAGVTSEFFPNSDSPANGGVVIAPTTASGGNTVDIDFSLAVNSVSSGDPRVGIIARDDSGATVSSLVVDVPSDTIFVGGVAGTNSNAHPTLGTGNYYEYLLQLNYATQQASVFSYPANSTTVSSFTPATLVLTQPFNTGASTFQYGALTLFAPTGTTGTTSGAGNFDNYLVTQTNTVPEPATVSMLVGGLAVVGGRRRRNRVTAR